MGFHTIYTTKGHVALIEHFAHQMMLGFGLKGAIPMSRAAVSTTAPSSSQSRAKAVFLQATHHFTSQILLPIIALLPTTVAPQSDTLVRKEEHKIHLVSTSCPSLLVLCGMCDGDEWTALMLHTLICPLLSSSLAWLEGLSVRKFSSFINLRMEVCWRASVAPMD